MNTQQEKFITYIRTKQVFSLRYRGLNDEMQPIHISSKEIETRFFPFPKYNRKKEIYALVEKGKLLVSDVNGRFFYEVTTAGKIDLKMLEVKPLPKDEIYQTMLSTLKLVSLPQEAKSTDYFNLFLKYNTTRPQLFFSVDVFAGRVHTPISNFHRTHRPYLILDGQETTSLDVATMQPLLLGKLLFEKLGKNEYSEWINEGKDIYIELQNKAGLQDREYAKKKFFEILFSKPSKALELLFGSSAWINWINEYKGLKIIENPHNKAKPHSNLAWLLQRTEVKIMGKVWKRLASENILFLGVHDEVIVKITDAEKAYRIMSEVLKAEFVYFKINCDKLKSETDFLAIKEKGINEPKNILSKEILDLRNYFSELECCGKLETHNKRNRIVQLWQDVINLYHTPQLKEIINELNQIRVNYG
ncbi:MAG: hypothetical protein EOO47_17495 [Flavobacterium sp.]|nr:MAG: hypothetical protein EOO47_17495 [Flavobacterium sp.]